MVRYSSLYVVDIYNLECQYMSKTAYIVVEAEGGEKSRLDR